MINPTSNAASTNVVMTESAPRPTPTPARVSFQQVLAAGANGVVRGAEMAMSAIPGSPLTATAVRGGAMTPAPGLTAGGATLTAEGPGASAAGGTLGVGGVSVGAIGSGGAGTPDVSSALAQSQEMSLYYLQVQQQMNAQDRAFSTLSNVMKAQHDTAKNAIGNIR